MEPQQPVDVRVSQVAAIYGDVWTLHHGHTVISQVLVYNDLDNRGVCKLCFLIKNLFIHTVSFTFDRD
jgi:hypothetical protein